MSTLQERLALAMEGTGIKAADLARATGRRGASVSAWINGPTQDLKGENLIRASQLLGVQPSYAKTTSNLPFVGKLAKTANKLVLPIAPRVSLP